MAIGDFLQGALRGGAAGSQFYDRQTNRRLAAEQGAREQADFDREANERRLSEIFKLGRNEKYIMLDQGAEGRIGLTDTLKQSFGVPGNAQQFVIDNFNEGGASKIPQGFKVTTIDAMGKDEDGNDLFAVRGNYDGDPNKQGAITETGSNAQEAKTKLFTRDELFEQAQQAFRTQDGGVLYGQKVVDLNDYANNRDLIQANDIDTITNAALAVGGVELQRQVGGILAQTGDREEKAELIRKLGDDFNVQDQIKTPEPTAGQPAEEESKEEPKQEEKTPAPKDNSAQIAKLERELEAITNRKTGSRRANQRLAERKRQEIARLKEGQEPEKKSFLERIFATPIREPGTPANMTEFMPAIVEEKVAPVLENKTVKEIDEAVDNGEITTDPEVVQAAAQNLQEEGVESVADLAKLSPRKQLFVYALISASTPNDSNRVNVRDQMINVMETGVSDRGASSVAQQKADTAAGRLSFDIAKNLDDLVKEGADAAVEANKALVDAIYKDEDGEATFAQLSMAKANEVANTIFPPVVTQYEGFLRRGQTAAADALRPQMNAAISFVVQSLAEDGDRGLIDGFFEAFNPDVNGQFNGDLSNIFIEGGELIYTEGGRERGKRISIRELSAINDNLADAVVRAAKANTAAKTDD